MKRTLFVIMAVMLPSLTILAQQVRSSFVNMPDSLSTLLTKVNREDFIDFLDSNMKAEVNNLLGGKSEMTKLTADFLEMKMTEQSTYQMKVLTKVDGIQVLCTVSTVCGPVCDSHIDFYATDWQPLSLANYLPQLPVLADFLQPMPEDASYALRDAYRQADILLMKAELSPEAAILTFTITTPDYMDAEAVKLLQPYIIPAIIMQWNGKMFVKK